MIKMIKLSLCVLMIPLGSASAGALTEQTWRIQMDTRSFGPVEVRMLFVESEGNLVGKSDSGSLDLIAALPDALDRDFGDALFSVRLSDNGDAYEGTVHFAGRDAPATLTKTDSALEGEIKAGRLQGKFEGVLSTDAGALRDYLAVFAALKSVTAEKIFDARDLDEPGYLLFVERMGAIAANARDDLDFLAGFQLAWMNDPFSHYDLRRSEAPAAVMMDYFDNLRIGKRAARVSFEGDVAVLDIDTMMGADTIEYIQEAYQEIVARGSKALVIDLRDNGGGAFAIKPLLEHVIDVPLDAGYFLSHKWNEANDRLPSTAEIAATPAWKGWSIKAFWRTVQDEALLKVTFNPAEPNFDGPVFVVLNKTSASATELALDAFRSSGGAILIGEATAGQMLSQSPFDVADGFQISLPVADYYSVEHGRIEGAGVPVNIVVQSELALDAAIVKAKAAIKE